MRRIQLYISCCFLSFFIIFSNSVHSYVDDTSRFQLDNGMTVLVNEMPSSENISIYMLVRVGSIFEDEYLGSGISHFMEHMFFKGTQKFEVGDIGAHVKELGGRINAGTSFEYTIYTIDVPKDKFNEGFNLVADMMMNARIDPEEVEKERLVVHKEMNMVNDRPERKLNQVGFENAYKQHPYRHPVIGYKPLFDQISRENLYDFYKKHYTPNNMILSIAGAVDVQEIRPLIEKTFENFKPTNYLSQSLIDEPQQVATRYREIAYPTDLTRVNLAFQGVSLLHKDMYALDVLGMALGQGETSRLWKRLYKDLQYVSRVSSFNWTPKNRGMFSIDYVLKDDVSSDQVDEVIWQEIDKIKKDGLTDLELLKNQRTLQLNSIKAKQESSNVARQAAMDEYYLGDHMFSDKYVGLIEQITNEDIKRVTNQYFHADQLSKTVMTPESQGLENSDTDHDDLVGEIYREELDNGLTILFLEDKRLPTVSLQVACNAGVRQETPETNGLSQLTADVMVQGTKNKTSEEFAEDVAVLGSNLGSWTGQNSLGMGLNVLNSDFDKAFDLLSEVISKPRFDPKDVERSKSTMKANLLARQDSPFNLSMKALRKGLFQEHRFRMEKYGTPESIDSLSAKDLREYHSTYFQPDNMIVTVYGDVDRDHVLKRIKKQFGSLKNNKLDLYRYDEPLGEAKTIDLTHDKSQAMLMIGFRGPTIYNDDGYSLNVLSSILGSSLSGRMFQRIRDELGQAYSLSAFYVKNLDNGVVIFYVLTENKYIEDVQKALFEEIEKTRQEFVTEKEIQESKNSLIGRHKSTLDSSDGLMHEAMMSELYDLGYDYYLDYENKLDQVTQESIKQVADKYLNPDHAVVTILKSSKEE